MKKDYYSVKEFADLLGVSKLTIRRAINAGRICALKVGMGHNSHFRIRHEELIKLQMTSFEEQVPHIKAALEEYTTNE